jgi:hypothetical protein
VHSHESQKFPVSFIKSVHLSVYVSLAPIGQVCMQFDFGDLHEKSLQKIHISLKSDKIIGTLHEDLNAFYSCRQINSP